MVIIRAGSPRGRAGLSCRPDVLVGTARPSGVWNADAVGEGTKVRKGPAPICSEEVFGHAVDGRPITYLGGSCPLSEQQRTIARFRFAPLVVSPGDIDPVPTLPLRSGNQGRTELPGVFDGGSAVTENLSDTDLVENDAGRAKGGEPVIGIVAQPVGGDGGLAEVFRSDTMVTVDGCGVGGDFEKRAVHR